jgi:hypothetical protein
MAKKKFGAATLLRTKLFGEKQVPLSLTRQVENRLDQLVNPNLDFSTVQVKMWKIWPFFWLIFEHLGKFI